MSIISRLTIPEHHQSSPKSCKTISVCETWKYRAKPLHFPTKSVNRSVLTSGLCSLSKNEHLWWIYIPKTSSNKSNIIKKKTSQFGEHGKIEWNPYITSSNPSIEVCYHLGIVPWPKTSTINGLTAPKHPLISPKSQKSSLFAKSKNTSRKSSKTFTILSLALENLWAL